MTDPDPWLAYGREIHRLRAQVDPPRRLAPYDGDDGDDPVQLSVRLSPRLRHDIAQVARREGTSVTAFVTEALEAAVRVATDPFAGLAARVTADLRAELGHAVDRGAYGEAAEAVDRAQAGDLRT